MFCVVLWSAIGPRIEALRGQDRAWLYVDDVVVHAPFAETPSIVQAIDQGITQGLGGHLNTSKSALHVPCLARRPWQDWPCERRETLARKATPLATRPPEEIDSPILPAQEDGLTILGSDTASDWTTVF